MVELLSLNFSVLTVKLVGVRKFRNFTVLLMTAELRWSHKVRFSYQKYIEPTSINFKTCFLSNLFFSNSKL